jgi:hypothetical protein
LQEKDGVSAWQVCLKLLNNGLQRCLLYVYQALTLFVFCCPVVYVCLQEKGSVSAWEVCLKLRHNGLQPCPLYVDQNPTLYVDQNPTLFVFCRTLLAGEGRRQCLGGVPEAA